MSTLSRNLVSLFILGISVPLALASCSGDDDVFPSGDASVDGGRGGSGAGGGTGGSTSDAASDAKDSSTGDVSTDANVGAGGTSGAGGSTPGAGGTPGPDASDGSPGTGGTGVGGSNSDSGVGGNPGQEAGVGGNQDSGTGGGHEAGPDGGPIGDAGQDAISDAASTTRCATGCAVATIPMPADGGADTQAFFQATFTAMNLTGATATIRFCVKSGTKGSIVFHVQGGAPNWVMFSGGLTLFTNNWSNIGCDTGMHTLTLANITSDESFSATNVWAAGLQVTSQFDSSNTHPYTDPTVIYIDSFKITNVLAEAGTPPSYEFAPTSDGGQNLDGWGINPDSTNVPSTPGTSLGWTSGD